MPIPNAQTAPGVAEQFLIGLLKGDATLMSMATNVYATLAPAGAVYPFVEVFGMSGADMQALGFIITLSTQRYLVKAWDNTGSLQRCDAIMARAHKLLQGAMGTLANGTVEGVVRRSLIPMGSPSEGIQYRQLIGTYDVYVKMN